MTGAAEEQAVRNDSRCGVQDDVKGGTRGVRDLDPALDDGSRTETVNNIDLRPRIVSFAPWTSRRRIPILSVAAAW